MGLKTYLRKALNSAVERHGYEVVESRQLYEWQKDPKTQPSRKRSQPPKGAAEYLRPDNPRLQDLQVRYGAFNNQVTSPLVWTDTAVSPDDICYFRGDNAYVWQLRGSGMNMNIMGYVLTAYYVKSIDKFGLLDSLAEDDSFGIVTFRIADRVMSRDLLDSIVELYFLERHLGVSLAKDMTILDIGAGYGRLAHRVTCALPGIRNYFCTDAVAVSSFISEYYLRFRSVEGRAKVVPLDEIENTLGNATVNIAVNIHSFAECRISAIEW